MFRSRDKNPNCVFLVYGRDHQARHSLRTLLEELGLRVLSWEDAIALTGQAAPHARAVLDAAMGTAAAVVVLLTGDDEARLRGELCGDDERATEGRLQRQARPNVIFEAGLAFALFPTRTIVVQTGRLRPISDLAGVQFVPFDQSTQSTSALCNRLRIAGCRLNATANVKTDGSSATRDLPEVIAPPSGRAKVAMLRRLRAFLPLPGLGGELEVARDVRIGEKLIASVCTDRRQAIRIVHWLPGNPDPQPLDLGSGIWVEDSLELPMIATGPAGIHVLDLLVDPDGSGEVVAARSEFAVSEK